MNETLEKAEKKLHSFKNKYIRLTRIYLDENITDSNELLNIKRGIFDLRRKINFLKKMIEEAKNCLIINERLIKFLGEEENEDNNE